MRLATYATAVALATQVGLVAVAVALVCADVVATVTLHALGARRNGLVMPGWMVPAPLAAALGLLVLGLLLG